MTEHIRPTAPPPTRVRVDTANASAAPLTGGLLAASGIDGDSNPTFAANAVT
ncbi:MULTISPECIES: hypothetical protein [unclassified Streptomyces]|uniref:hypothetical protein n=1 Tax=unclassified Streptomyces TaxID=2593676 RepID=UPI003BB5D55C